MSKERPKAGLEETALGILSRREHSVGELREKLLSRGYEREEIAGLLSRFLDLGYLNDVRYAAMMKREILEVRRRGPQALRLALRRAKVAEELISDVMAEVKAEGASLDVIKVLAAKKLALLKRVESGKRRDKLARFLLGRGFAYDDVTRVVNETLLSEEKSDDYDGA